MNGPGNQFLARTAFTGDQHIGLGGTDLMNLLVNAGHTRTVADDPVKMQIILDLGFLVLFFLFKCLKGQGPGDGLTQFIVVKRFRDEIIRPFVHGFHRDFRGGIRGDHDHHCVGVLLFDLLEYFQAGDVTKTDIHQRQIIGMTADQLQCAFSVFSRSHTIIFLRQQQLQKFPHTGVIVHHQQFEWVAFRFSHAITRKQKYRPPWWQQPFPEPSYL